jgi:hypothetical protein
VTFVPPSRDFYAPHRARLASTLESEARGNRATEQGKKEDSDDKLH